MSWWLWLLIAFAVIVAVWAGFVLWLTAAGRREDARALASFIPDCIVLVTRLARDPRVPRRRKLLLLALVGYLALPFDLVPDFIPVAGQLDDAIIVALVIRHFVKAGGEQLIRELWPGPQQSLNLVLQLARARTPTEAQSEMVCDLGATLSHEKDANSPRGLRRTACKSIHFVSAGDPSRTMEVPGRHARTRAITRDQVSPANRPD